MNQYKSATPWPATEPNQVPPGQEMTTAVPVRPPGFVADVVVPMAQAAVTGAVIGGLLTWAGVQLFHYRGRWLTLWGGLALGIGAVAWLLLLVDTRRLLWAIEKLSGVDLDQDGVTGEPEPQERVVFVDGRGIRDQAAQQAQGQTRSRFAWWVSELERRGTTARGWEPVLGRELYQTWRDGLIRLGWARWCSTDEAGNPNPLKGWELTMPASEILRRVQ